MMRALNKHSFSLVEVIISIVIAATLFVLVLQVVAMINSAEAKSTQYAFSANYAEGILEKILEAPYDEIDYGNTLSPSGFEMPSSAQEHKPIEKMEGAMEEFDFPGAYYTISIQELHDNVANSDYKLVTVSIHWQTYGRESRPLSFELSVRIYPEPEI